MKQNTLLKQFSFITLILVIFTVFLLAGCNQKNDKFTKISDLKIPRMNHTATLLKNGKVLIIGNNGNYALTAELYDPKTNKFSIIKEDKLKPKIHKNYPHHYDYKTLLLSDGKVLINLYGQLQIFDPANNSFKIVYGLNHKKFIYKPGHSTTTVPTKKRFPSTAMAALPNGNVIFAGSIEPIFEDTKHGKRFIKYKSYASVDIFNPSTGKFTNLGSMLENRFDPEIIVLPNNKVLFLGGANSDKDEILDLKTNKLSLINTIRPKGYFTHSISSDNKILFINETYEKRRITSIKARIYDLPLKRLSAEGIMNIPRKEYKVAILKNGDVLFTGGVDNKREIIKEAEVFNQESGKFKIVGNTVWKRRWHETTTLKNGDVLITGGINPTGYDARAFNKAEVFTTLK